MSALLFYDTETCGKPVWEKRSSDPCQPHLVQIGAVLADASTHEIIDSLDVIIKPDGWIISDEVIAIHGITNKRAHAEGIPELEALDMFLCLHERCVKRIGHNEGFDARMIRIAIKRHLDDDIADAFSSRPAECTGHLTRAAMKLPNNKMPTLGEVYQRFIGKPLVNGHNAFVDATACMEVHLASQRKVGRGRYKVGRGSR